MEEALRKDGYIRDGKWSESVAVGSKSFVEEIKKNLGIRVIGREVIKTGNVYEPKEADVSYGDDFDGKMGTLRQENTYLWCIYDDNSI